jgi:triacylglycerol lipase
MDSRMNLRPIPDDLNLLIPPVAPSDYAYFAQIVDRPQFVFDATGLSWVNAWWLAECSLLAYCDEPSVRAGLDGTGLAAEFFQFENFQAYVMWDATKVIVAFRGTELPKAKTTAALAESALDWIGNLNLRLDPWPSLGKDVRVHAGFLAAASGVFAQIKSHVASLTADGHRKLWLTGHSLGGALATLCAHMFAEVQGVYVFGSPRVGDSAFAVRYARPLWRFSNHSDVVVTVPPNWSLPFGFARDYQHVGRSVWFDVNQTMAHGESPFSFLTTQPPASVLDHAPIAYSVLAWNQI